jgi:Glu-tRNA(Gln) amidotransferase subunit E-like FAD-binding protein
VGRESSVTALPEEVRNALNQELAARNFTGYAELEDWLRGQGFEISKSAIHRYGQKIERRMAAIKASTEAAKFITEAAGDDQDARSEAVIALVQTEMFDSIIAIQEAADEELSAAERLGMMSDAAKNIAALTRASIAQKQFKTIVQARAQEAADKVAKLAKKGGMSASTVDEIKRSILGIAA